MDPPQLLKPPLPRACALQREKSAQAPQLESSPHSLELEKAQAQPKIKLKFIKMTQIGTSEV